MGLRTHVVRVEQVEIPPAGKESPVHDDCYHPPRPVLPPAADNVPAALSPNDATPADLDDATSHMPSVESLSKPTDLPCPLRGNGGNHEPPCQGSSGELHRLLDLADRLVPAPPLSRVDPAAVRKWVTAATAGMISLREAIRLAGAVERIIDEHSQTTISLDRQRELLRRREAQRQAKTEGRYWRERDAGRRAQQPTHVEVDPDAWDALKAKAVARNRRVGTLVGYLVSKEVDRCEGKEQLSPLPPGRPGEEVQGRRAKRFARLEVSKARWQQFRALAIQRHITVARYVGLLVEAA
ncbi:MAG TPA: hypothetical protein VK988_07545 [Acidimicrobiales bacterium]|nr:hypothetical protein [Acidimicrobiales bacterium]